MTMLRQGISVCALAHETSVSPFGERGLELFLEHVSARADEVILVDTSVDGSVSRMFCSVYSNVRVVRSQNVGKPLDLSRERNYSLEQAEHEWVLVLDPDERILNWGVIRLIAMEKKDVSYILSGDLVFHPDEYIPDGTRKSGDSHMHRLFQNGEGYNFSGEVYEELKNRNKRASSLLTTGTVDCGWEHHQTVAQRFEHAERYAKMTGVYDPLPGLMRDLATMWERVRRREELF